MIPQVLKIFKSTAPLTINHWLGCTIVAILMLGGTGLFACQSSAPTDEFDRIAALLGLEPSEYGRLLTADPLPINDDLLLLAIGQLGERPFRLLPKETATSNSENSGGRVMRITGAIEHLWEHSRPLDGLVADQASGTGEHRLTAGSIYECWIRTDSETSGPMPPTTVRVLTRHVPQLWRHLTWQSITAERKQWKPLDSAPPLRVSALVFDLGEKQWINEPSETPNADDSADVAESRRMRTGLAKRLEWPETSSRVLLDLLERANSIEKSTPATVDGEARARHWRQRLAGHWSELGAIGFDLGLWDMVAKGQRRGLQPGDNEPFYQLLITSPQWSSAETETEELPLRELLQNPQDLVGQTFKFHATIKQVTKVPSDPGDRAAQLGLGEYYLLHGVIQLPRPLRLKFDGQRQIEYQRHFPLVIATTQLPAGLAVGDQIRQWVRGDGRLFKLWSYQSLRSQEAGVDQLAPLLVASHVRLAGPPTDGTAPWPISGLLLIPVGMGLLFLLFFGFYGLRRRS